MLNNFSVYRAFVAFKDKPEDGKSRPVVIIKISEDSNNISALGVYSYKDKFIEKNKSKFYNSFLCRVDDIEIAGLDPELISFVDVSTYEHYNLKEMIEDAEYLGELSQKDSLALSKKHNQFHSQ